MKKKISIYAIASIGFCILTPICFIGSLFEEFSFLIVFSLGLPICAILLGLMAWDDIRKAKGELIGKWIAFSGMILGGLLIALFFKPYFSAELAAANAVTTGNNGRIVVLSIISANKEREAKCLAPVWPSASADFTGMQKDYTKVPDSETYFTDLLDSGSVKNLPWYIFAGAGVSAATSSESFLQGNHNVWNVIAGLDENARDDTPFMFTRNLNITVADLRANLRDNEVGLQSKLDYRIKPYGDNLILVLQKGGAMQTLKRVYMRNPALFLGSSVFNHEINKNAKVLKAKGMHD